MIFSSYTVFLINIIQPLDEVKRKIGKENEKVESSVRFYNFSGPKYSSFRMTHALAANSLKDTKNSLKHIINLNVIMETLRR